MTKIIQNIAKLRAAQAAGSLSHMLDTIDRTQPYWRRKQFEILIDAVIEIYNDASYNAAQIAAHADRAHGEVWGKSGHEIADDIMAWAKGQSSA